MPVQFYFLTRSISLSKRKELKAFIEFLFKNEKRKLESLTYIFCSDEYLLTINQDFLEHNYYTDIITFDLSETKRVIGEVYISVERVKENAKHLDISVTNEFHRVIFHGALHLCGYKDKVNQDIKKMRDREDFYLAQFFK